MSGQLHAPAALPPGKSPRYPFYRRLGGPQSRSGPYGEVKLFDPTGTRTPAPLVIQPVASRYTDWAIPTPLKLRYNIYFVSRRNKGISVTIKCCNFSMYLSSIYLSMALEPFVGPWPLLQFLDLFRQFVRLFGRGISPLQGRYLHTGQHKHRINSHKHPCLKWESKPRFHYLSGQRQFMT
jgi:hypothetical protein